MDNKGRPANGGKKELQSVPFCSRTNGGWAFCRERVGPSMWFDSIWRALFSSWSHTLRTLQFNRAKREREKKECERGSIGAAERVSHRAAELRQVNVLKTWPCPVKSAVLRFTDSGGYQRNAWAAGWQLENSHLLKDEVELCFYLKKKIYIYIKKSASQIILTGGYQRLRKKERKKKGANLKGLT